MPYKVQIMMLIKRILSVPYNFHWLWSSTIWCYFGAALPFQNWTNKKH